MKGLINAASTILWISSLAGAQRVTLMVSPFDSSPTGKSEIGKKTGIILSLQIWQTLRIPTTQDGSKTRGTVNFDVTSTPPTSYTEAEALAAEATDYSPEMVLWGRAWPYGTGTVVEAFLLVRGHPLQYLALPQDLWTIVTPNGSRISVGVPRRQVEFSPIILRGDLLPELQEPSDLKLYAGPTGDAIKGTVGGGFTAQVQGIDTAEVLLPNGTTGWIRLPNLSQTHSEVVDFSSGLVRIFRHDWSGAFQLLTNVVNNSHTPAAVRIDAYLYMAVAADKMGKSADQWVAKAYELNPYSKTVIQYLCMSELSEFSRLSQEDQKNDRGRNLVNSLNQIVTSASPLFAPGDIWLKSVRTSVSSEFPSPQIGPVTAELKASPIVQDRIVAKLDITNLDTVHKNHGDFLFDLGNYDDAINEYQMALKITPNYAEAHNGLGKALQQENKYDDAVKQFQAAISIEPNFAEALNNLGIALEHIGQYDDAISDYRKALKLRPEFAEAKKNLSRALALKRRN
jgi:tetratricopeptide (TPR) repeat protein